MSKFNSGTKASREIAEASLDEYVRSVCDSVFAIRFESDDGGSLINLYIEVEDPSVALEPYLHDALVQIKWEGWRYVVTRVGPDYIDCVMSASKWDE